MKVSRFAAIGTRRFGEIPEASRERYLQAVESFAEAGWELITGAAEGADQEAAERALKAGGSAWFLLPVKSFQRAWLFKLRNDYPLRVRAHVFDPDLHREWAESVEKYHPRPDRLSEFARAAMARNYGLIDLSLLTLALRHPSKTGGTEQGIRLARALKKPLIIF
jgi:NAD(P)-dependent dehydrogenase (short-subunit alcohol dehydrogenase family)